MKYIASIISFSMCIFTGNVHAQSQMPPPPSAGPNMNILVPMLKAQLDALSNPELLDAQAKYFRALYLSLKEQGFTDEQAMQIVVAMASSRNSK